MLRRVAIAFVFATTPALAQTDAISGGILGDTSIIAPVVRWQRIYGDRVVSAGISGWELSASYATKSWIASASFTPLHSHSSNRIYVDGKRDRDLEYDNSTIEVNAGRIDRLSDRWSSDVRGVVLSERVPDDDRWDKPYAGIRVVQTYRDKRVEDPLLLRAEGFEASVQMEAFAGHRAWTRATVNEAFHRRAGAWNVGERASVFTGSALDIVNRFLIGGSWPVTGLNPLYGYRYAEFRIDRGATATVDVERSGVALHVSALAASGLRRQGVALDVARRWRGLGVRAGVAIPHQNGRHVSRVVLYGSVLGAFFGSK